MLELEKTLRASQVAGADLNCTDAWALVLTAHGMSDMVGHDHKRESAIVIDEKTRQERKFPHLLSLVNKGVRVKLTAEEVEQQADGTWDSALWSVWRADKENRSKVFLIGLEQHEYVEYENKTDYGEGGVMAMIHLSEQEQFRRTRHYVGAEKKNLFIAYFSSGVPSGYHGPPMGGDDEPLYPSYHFALAVTAAEYAELTSYLELPIAFNVEISFV